ncbi:MAG: DUF3794 domain-containing protein [Clostridia bacterium]|nr:DUF3794 domain-containing protein [Clostridia bacterium]
MDTELKKVTVITGEMLPPLDSAFLIEGDVIVPDIKPDASKIVSADADASIKKCEVMGNLLKISGVVFVNVLYLPEGENASPNAINTRFEFSENLPLIKNEGIKASASGTVRHIDFSLINSRKLNLKIYVGIDALSYSESSFEYIDNPNDAKILETKKQNFSLVSITDNSKNEIIVSENIEIPQSKADIGEILKVCLEPKITEYKALNDKVLVKGSTLVNILYLSSDSDEEVENIHSEIPFSDVFEVNDSDENTHIKPTVAIRDYYANIKSDINDNPRIISLEALVDVNILAYKEITCSPVVDCFAGGKNSELSLKEVSSNELLCDENIKLNIREKILCDEKNICEVLSCTLKPVVTEQVIANGNVTIKGLLAGSAALKNDDDALIFETLEIPFEHSQAISGLNEKSTVYCFTSLASKNYNISGGEAELFAVVNIDILALLPVSFSIVSDCNITKCEENSSLPMLVIYFVQSGDTIWDIAKRYKTTPEKIISANNITESDKICAGMKLLIPSF